MAAILHDKANIRYCWKMLPNVIFYVDYTTNEMAAIF